LERKENPRKYSVRIQKFQNQMVGIQMVNYKTPENIPFKKHPPKLGGSYSIMSGRWFGGGCEWGLRRPGCSKDEKTDIISIIWCDGVEMVGVMVCRR
jgi:hypothetical protein